MYGKLLYIHPQLLRKTPRPTGYWRSCSLGFFCVKTLVAGSSAMVGKILGSNVLYITSKPSTKAARWWFLYVQRLDLFALPLALPGEHRWAVSYRLTGDGVTSPIKNPKLAPFASISIIDPRYVTVPDCLL